MTIDEAIGILQYNGAPEEGPTISAFIIEARNLGIEALKRLQDLRKMKYVTYFVPLPGETE